MSSEERIEAILRAQFERAYQFAAIYAGKWAERRQAAIAAIAAIKGDTK